MSVKPLLLAVLLALSLALPAAAGDTQTVTLGHSTLPLNGPWKFATGDDPRRAAPDYDDGGWESVDLTPPPGAHDSDVGWKGYVPGWSARGHKGYAGFAWYRLRVAAAAPDGEGLAISGPILLDQAYQIYVDGRFIGGSGDFSRAKPSAYGIQPRLYPLPAKPAGEPYSIAIRVWTSPGGAAPPEGGGIHVAPQIGGREAMAAFHRDQWLQSFEGYVADAAEPALFALLALLMLPFAVRQPAWRWLAASLLVLGLLRVHQVLLFWTPWESLRAYDLARGVILGPFTLGVWTLAWRSWFKAGPPRLLVGAALALTLLDIAAQVLSRSWILPAAPHGLLAAAHATTPWLRLGFLALYLWALGVGIARLRRAADVLAILAAVLAGVGIFGDELSLLHVKGIWFPWGVGVARGQFAYAGLIIVLFSLIVTETARALRGRPLSSART